ncbi:MAG TPA: S8 family serine peptidase [Actinomycetes bacterium]|nr:S8 family serine peptidase [Actinomycetes bacterium]
MTSSHVAEADALSMPAPIDAIVHGDVTQYQWMLPAVNATAAQSEATGAGVTVAIIDTGVDATHPDLEGRVVPGAIVKINDVTSKPELVPATVEETSDDWYGHGSHVAGIIAADDDGNGVTGIAPDAEIMPIDLLPRRVWLNDIKFWNLVADGIHYSVAQGADVINMSLGGPSSGIAITDKTQKYRDALDNLCAAVDDAKAAGTVVVAAAGNSGSWGNPELKPGACPGSVTVAALSPSLDRTYWSSFDASVDLAAPGEDVLSVDSTVAENSATPHLFASGTSMATPVVAGVAALLSEQHPGWSSQQIEDQMTSTAKDLGVSGRDPDYGYGIVDAAAAVGAAAPSPKKQNFFATWYEPVWDAPGDESVVSWTTPDADPVTGYTVTVYTDTTAATYNVDGLTVRTQVLLPPGAWFTVTAHTTAGDVVSYPASRYVRDRGDSPERLQGIKLARKGDSMIISWDKPADRDKIDVIKGLVHFEGPGGAAERRLKVDPDQPFPTSIKIPLPKAGRWSDAHVHLGLYNKDDQGETIGVRWMTPNVKSPALYGSHVASIVGAGARNVEVAGAMSRLNAKRVCGKNLCEGESAVLVVDRGRSNDKFDVVFTSRGVFHTIVDVPRGTDSLRVRIVGPKRLDSGPFQKVQVDGGNGGGSDCRRGQTTPRGC